MRVAAATMVSLALIAGCSDPKKAGNGNFERAINDYVSKNPSCIAAPATTLRPADDDHAGFPQYVSASAPRSQYDQSQRQEAAKPLDALVDAGLLKTAKGTVTINSSFIGNNRSEVPATVYSLTDAGQKALVPGKRGEFVGTRDQFCYGKPVVDEIVQFTEPSEMMGVKLSRVSYRYHLGDVPSWASNAKVKAAFPEIARNTDKPLDGTATVVLTNNGWMHEKAAKL